MKGLPVKKLLLEVAEDAVDMEVVVRESSDVFFSPKIPKVTFSALETGVFERCVTVTRLLSSSRLGSLDVSLALPTDTVNLSPPYKNQGIPTYYTYNFMHTVTVNRQKEYSYKVKTNSNSLLVINVNQ